MPLTIFKTVQGNSLQIPLNSAILKLDNWDDYSFKTQFSLSVNDENGKRLELGYLKIGYAGQTESRTADLMPDRFEQLPENYFSLGQSPEYYKNSLGLSESTRVALFTALRDVVYFPQVRSEMENEKVFTTSLTRGISKSLIDGQFSRILAGGATLTAFNFSYRHDGDELNAAYRLDFLVDPESTPSTNIHVLIGRNGVGKTTLLNNMISSIVQGGGNKKNGKFFDRSKYTNPEITDGYFGGVASVSFSAFDPFVPPPEQKDRDKGLTNFYTGLKKFEIIDGERKAVPKSGDDLTSDFLGSLKVCLSQDSKRDRWLQAIQKLESDENFENMDLARLLTVDKESALIGAKNVFSKMSSGHMIVLLTITKLVETVEEKTLVLMDEPESHLHPPLLSAFIRALSELLSNRNGVAIIATHSPVVVQEVPKSCVWKLHRIRTEGKAERPEEETFGENVGTLTRDIFGLEVTKSGFHNVLSQAVNEGKNFDEIFREYGGQLGFEAQALLRAMIASNSARR